MTKRDFEAIAQSIKSSKPLWDADLSDSDFAQGNRNGRINALADVVDEMVEYFTATYPRFDEDHFRKACGF